MANKTEFSRLVFKRSTVTGIIPTIPTGDTIDNTWLDTDILIGEGFINVEDDKFWYRTNNGLVEVSLSGISSDNYYTDYVYFSGSSLIFDRTDTSAAYSIDLSNKMLALTGGTMSGPLYLDSIGSGTPIINIGIDSSGCVVTGTTGGGSGDFTGGTISGDVTFEGDSIFESDVTMDELSATTISILNSGATSRDYFDYSNNTIESGVTNSAIVGGSGNTIPSGYDNVFISGVDLTAAANDTAYFTNVNISGTLTGGGAAGGNYLPLSGGAMDSSAAISSANGGGQIDLDYGGAADEVMISTDGGLWDQEGQLYITPTYIELSAYGTGSTLQLATDEKTFDLGSTRIQFVMDNYRPFVAIDTGGSALAGNVVYFAADNTSVNHTSSNVGMFPGLISSRNSTINSGVTNSVVVGGSGITASEDNTLYCDNLNVAGNVTGAPCDLSFAISDETTAITTGTDKLTFYAPYAMNITAVYASLSESGSTSSQFDINNSGTSILSTKITIDSNEFHSNDAATPPVISSASVSQFDKLTVDIDTAGTSAAGAKIYIIGTRA